MFDLERFVEAQNPVYPEVCRELAQGRKDTHWMWFVFPQLRGLGLSETSLRFGIASLGEAKAYLQHPLLGTRLRECVSLAGSSGRSAHEIFGVPDVHKFRSSLTLFDRAEPGGVFSEALQRFFDGSRDPRTLALLNHLAPDNASRG